MILPQPVLSPITGNDALWVLDKDLVVEIDDLRITVKAGFETDGESIPRSCWVITGHPFQGQGMVAAIVHDVLYGSEILPRDRADLIFKLLLERYGVNWFRAMMRYRFLRMFGWMTWQTHTPTSRMKASRYVEVERLVAK